MCPNYLREKKKYFQIHVLFWSVQATRSRYDNELANRVSKLSFGRKIANLPNEICETCIFQLALPEQNYWFIGYWSVAQHPVGWSQRKKCLGLIFSKILSRLILRFLNFIDDISAKLSTGSWLSVEICLHKLLVLACLTQFRRISWQYSCTEHFFWSSELFQHLT